MLEQSGAYVAVLTASPIWWRWRYARPKAVKAAVAARKRMNQDRKVL